MDTVKARAALRPEQLRRRVDPADLSFETTADVPPLSGTIGQPRALDALEFALDVRAPGYNLYVAGVPGSGRETTVQDILQRVAPTRPTPSDWVYVYNFLDPDTPRAIALPAGQAVAFARDMDEFVALSRVDIPQAFESDDYERRRREALAPLSALRDDLFSGLEAFARDRGFALEAQPSGIATIPLVDGQPLDREAFQQLSAEAQHELRRKDAEIQEEVERRLRMVRDIDKDAAERIRALNRDVALFVVGPRLAELRERYALIPDLLAYLDQVENDIPDHLSDFHPAEAEQPEARIAQIHGMPQGPDLTRYRVNVLIDHSRTRGAPIVVERNPSYYNLLGRIDYRPAFGGVATDFRQIKPGALHRANGGFLVLHLLDVARNPMAWEALRRALVAREIQVENLGEQMTAVPTVRMRPEPIPLDVKVILLGPPNLYQALFQTDEFFQELFKVKADFSPEMDWSAEHLRSYAAFVSRRVREFGLRHFDRAAVARLIEEGARQRESQRKLSTRLLDIADIVTEASYYAMRSGHDPVMAADVDRAIRQRAYRSNLVEERMQEMITEGTIAIDTTDDAVGRVNGLSVFDLGDYVFGKPTRVTARVAIGRGTVQSIEREIALSGPIHSKGVLTLAGYLAGQYGQQAPLALSATITFEQSYEGVDGDSASSTELYALLSALADLPLDQGIAVTGSVNQFGEVQAVGGVTRKIEGFFAVCQAQGLTGRQGVMIPATNVPNLMLSEEVIEAVRAGRFHVWAVQTIDEGLEILTGRPAGQRDPDGRFPEGTVHRLVEDRLLRYAGQLRRYATGLDGVEPSER